jgi:hypothetical protein
MKILATRRRPRRASRNLSSTALISTKTECGSTRLRMLKAANNGWSRLRNAATGITARRPGSMTEGCNQMTKLIQ